MQQKARVHIVLNGPVPAIFGWKNRVILCCTTTLTSFSPESSIVSLFRTYPATRWIILCVFH